MAYRNNEQFVNKLDRHVKEHFKAKQQQKSVNELDAMIGLLLLNKSTIVEPTAAASVQASMTTTVAPNNIEASTAMEATKTTVLVAPKTIRSPTATVLPTTLPAPSTKRAPSPIQTLMEALETINSPTTIVAQTAVQETLKAPPTTAGPAITQATTITRLPTATVAPTIIQAPKTIGANAETSAAIHLPTTNDASTIMQASTTFVPTARRAPTTVHPPRKRHSVIVAPRAKFGSAAMQAPTTMHYATAAVPAPSMQAPAATFASVTTQKRTIHTLIEALVSKIKQTQGIMLAESTVQVTVEALAELEAPVGFAQPNAGTIEDRVQLLRRLSVEYMQVVSLLNRFICPSLEE